MIQYLCQRCGHECAGPNADCPKCGSRSFRLETGERSPVKDTNPKDAIGDKKAPLHLLSPIAMLHWSLAQFAGLLKYGAWNWRPSGVRASVYIAAIKRHTDAYLSGEYIDPVDGSHHLGNVMACCAILLEAEAAGNLTDDRPPVLGHRTALTYVEKQMEVLRAQYADRAPRHYTIADEDHLPKL
jgi:DNA-directed RNA polymerase subunit RPC12/RpoP